MASSPTYVSYTKNGVPFFVETQVPVTARRAPSPQLQCINRMSEIQHIRNQGSCFSILNVEQEGSGSGQHGLPYTDYVVNAYIHGQAPIVAMVYPFVTEFGPMSLLDLQNSCIAQLNDRVPRSDKRQYKPVWIELQSRLNGNGIQSELMAEKSSGCKYWSVLSSRSAAQDLKNCQDYWYNLVNNRGPNILAASYSALRLMHATCTWGVGLPACRNGNFAASEHHVPEPYELYIPGKTERSDTPSLKTKQDTGARSSVLQIPAVICTNHKYSPKHMTGLRFPQQDCTWLAAYVRELPRAEFESQKPKNFESDLNQVIYALIKYNKPF